MFPEIEKVPEELKQKMTCAFESIQRLRRAEKQIKLWNDELNNAQTLQRGAEKDFNDLLNRWNPSTNEIVPLEENPDKKL